MTKEDYLRLLESVDTTDGSIAFSRIWDIVHDYLINFPESTLAGQFDGYVGLDTANEMMKKEVNDGCDVLYMHEFTKDIEPYDEFFLVGADNILLHIREHNVKGLLYGICEQIKSEMENPLNEINNKRVKAESGRNR